MKEREEEERLAAEQKKLAPPEPIKVEATPVPN